VQCLLPVIHRWCVAVSFCSGTVGDATVVKDIGFCVAHCEMLCVVYYFASWQSWCPAWKVTL